MPTEDDNLRRRMQTLAVFEEDLVEKFILGSGSGGQKINKTASCVYIKHLPSGIEVKCQRSRSRDKNRNLARQELCQRLEEAEAKRSQLKKAARARRRVQARGRSRSTKRKMLEKKRQRGETKRLRGPVRD